MDVLAACRKRRSGRVPRHIRGEFSRTFSGEQLEDRHLLATFMVTHLLDHGSGSLRQAILDANGLEGSDDILFDAGISGTIGLTSGQLAITESLNIDGPGADSLTIDAQGSSRIFQIVDASVTLEGLTMVGGSAGFGGAIHAFGDDVALNIVSSAITGNVASVLGGGIYVASQSSLILTSSTIEGNTAGGVGGGIAAYSDTEITLDDSTLTGNTADINGGGIYVSGKSTASIIDSMVTANSAGLDGGGIIVFLDSDLTLSRSTVDSNVAGRFGGGIAGRQSIVISLTDTAISGNSAAHGGGIRTNRTDLNLSNSNVTSNVASGNGGGIDWIQGPSSREFTIADSNVSGNSAGGRGGGISGDKLALDTSTVSGNSAKSHGGGIDTAGYELTLTGSTVSGNYLSGINALGGGISADGNTTIDNSTISGERGSAGNGWRFEPECRDGHADQKYRD